MNKQILLTLSIEDLNKYYAGTWIKVIPPGGKEFGYICVEGFKESTSGTKILFITESKTRDCLLKNLELDFSLPEAGYYNFKDHSIYYYQLVYRQWRKAITHDFCNFVPFHCAFYERMDPDHSHTASMRFRFQWGAENFNSLFLSPRGNISQSISDIFKGKVFSRALSKDFLISLGVSSLSPQLWFRQRLIGTFTTPGKIKISCDLFKEEAKDFFLPQQINVS